MTQKQISYFEKAYETRNIAAAADQLFVSRSVISRSIQELEEEFGVTFFERSKSGITPTEAGNMLHSTLLQMASCYSSLTNRFRDLSTNAHQRILRIGVTPTNAQIMAKLLFGSFRDAFPDIKVRITEKDHFEMIAFLSGGEVDLVAIPGQHADMTIFDMLPLYDVQIVLAVHKSNPLSQKTKLGVMDLQFQPLAFLSTPLPNVERIMNASMEAANQKANIVIRASNVDILRDLTERGLVCAVLPDDMIKDWKDVVGIPLDFTSGVTTHKLLWNKAVPLSSAAEDFISFCKKHFEDEKDAPKEPAVKTAGGLSSNFYAELLDLPACKSKGYCDGCGRCEH